MASWADILMSIRELSFDRFVTPTVYVRAKATTNTPRLLTIDASSFSVQDSAPSQVTNIDLTSVTSLQALIDALQSDTEKYQLAVSSSFIGSEPSTSLTPITGKDISSSVVALYRQYFFSEDFILKNVVYDYFLGVLCYAASALPSDIGDLKTFVETEVSEKLLPPYDKHMAIWCAYHILEQRRVYEAASLQLDATSFFDSDSDIGLVQRAENSGSITMSIGDVFSISQGPETEDLTNDIHLAGVDNVLGDKNSFWYRNQLHLRNRLEYLFSDFSLRKDQVIQGTTTLEKPLNGYAYYDNYPWTLSPISRGILQS